ncbi:MAG: hypothetical protein HZA22_11770 [Nitrospirae bacterium]|nr:hypothetical protein [Nitrospirota bacterium]MBI5696466.1 hypothetical protein [Nitrospirota bacterium]
MNYGTQVSHQSNESSSGTTTRTSSQDKLNFYYNITGKPSAGMSLLGKLKLDIVKDTRDGSEGTQAQPSLSLQLSSRGFQAGTGYRENLRDEIVMSGNTTTTRSTESKDLYFDNTISPGKLPSLRMRYGTRESRQISNGVTGSDTVTDEVSFGTNYDIGIFTLNADYRTQKGKNRSQGGTSGSSDFSGQLAMAKIFGGKLRTSLRENYSYSKVTPDKGGVTKKSVGTTEAKAGMGVLRYGSVNTSYIYRVQEDLLDPAARVTENTWSTAAAYKFPKYVKLYGNYTARDTENSSGITTSDTTVMGVNFNHRVGRFDIVSRYEKRNNTFGRKTAAATVTRDTSRDNLDWMVNVRISGYLSASLSEAYVLNSAATGETSTDQYRLKVNFGPVRNLLVAPYVDYTVTTGVKGQESTTTILTVPVAYRLTLHDNLDINITDNYTRRSSGGISTTPASENNNAVIRLTLRRPLPGTSVSADASFSSSSTGNGVATTTSSYSLTGNWNMAPHTISANMRYQTGSNTFSSSSYGLQYGVYLRLKRVTLNLQARYSYSVTNSTPESTAQSVYIVLNMKK